ncbi:MAG: DNA alkylation repair protein [Anaerolineales bacterium]|nr:DNA alkylation repair protein [Anaerolineales bacterium]
MTTVTEVMEKLTAQADPAQLDGMSRFGITTEKRLGVTVPQMRVIAKQTGKDHELALVLWETGIAEAMIVAAMVDVPAEVTEAQMEAWVVDFNSWDVCDQVCMNLFEKTPLAWDKIRDWSQREEEYVKRAAYALIACLAWHDKGASDENFIALFPLIKSGATDERNYVKKAVSWALRNIGKRNSNLNAVALQTAQDLKEMDLKSARWIGSDAVRDLNSDATRRRLGRTG